MTSRIELGQAFGLKKGVNFFLSLPLPSSQAAASTRQSNAGKPEALATGTNQFSCSERRLFHPRASEVKGTSDSTGGKNSRPHVCPVKTSLLPDDQRVTTSAQTRQERRRRDTQRCGYPRQHRQSVIRRSTGEPDWDATSSYEDLVGLA